MGASNTKMVKIFQSSKWQPWLFPGIQCKACGSLGHFFCKFWVLWFRNIKFWSIMSFLLCIIIHNSKWDETYVRYRSKMNIWGWILRTGECFIWFVVVWGVVVGFGSFCYCLLWFYLFVDFVVVFGFWFLWVLSGFLCLGFSFGFQTGKLISNEC